MRTARKGLLAAPVSGSKFSGWRTSAWCSLSIWRRRSRELVKFKCSTPSIPMMNSVKLARGGIGTEQARVFSEEARGAAHHARLAKSQASMSLVPSLVYLQ